MMNGWAESSDLRSDRLLLARLILGPLIVSYVVLHHGFEVRLGGRTVEIAFALMSPILLVVFIGDVIRKIRAQRSLQGKVEDAIRATNVVELEARREVAIWLHSSVQPSLLRIAKRVEILNDPAAPTVASDIAELGRGVVRDAAHKLHPPQLEISLELALTDLLSGRAELLIDPQLSTRTYASGVTMKDGKAVSFDGWAVREERLHLDWQMRYAIYRVIAEAVANAERKSSMSKIVVEIIVQSRSIRVKVIDDGAPVPIDPVKGFGLSVIEAMVRQYGGSFTLENDVQGGVVLDAHFPYERKSIGEVYSSLFERAE